LVLDGPGNVDPGRTREIFGHPAGGYVVQLKNPVTKTVTTKRFRPVGLHVGLFRFESKIYFDTFYDEWGDLKNERRKDPHIANTLAVLKHENKNTDLICEVLWNPRKQ
jgi:hypothetical protein